MDFFSLSWAHVRFFERVKFKSKYAETISQTCEFPHDEFQKGKITNILSKEIRVCISDEQSEGFYNGINLWEMRKTWFLTIVYILRVSDKQNELFYNGMNFSGMHKTQYPTFVYVFCINNEQNEWFLGHAHKTQYPNFVYVLCINDEQNEWFYNGMDFSDMHKTQYSNFVYVLCINDEQNEWF